jgi:hypothetical protein
VKHVSVSHFTTHNSLIRRWSADPWRAQLPSSAHSQRVHRKSSSAAGLGITPEGYLDLRGLAITHLPPSTCPGLGRIDRELASWVARPPRIENRTLSNVDISHYSAREELL